MRTPSLLASLALLASAPLHAQTTIDFDIGGVCLFSNAPSVSLEFGAQGVEFSGPALGDGGVILNRCSNFGIDPRSGDDFLGFSRFSNSQTGAAGGPQAIGFAEPVQTVSIWAAEGFGSGAVIEMEAFLLGSSVDLDVVALPPDGWHELRVSSPGGIDRVVLSEVAGSTEDWVFDDLVLDGSTGGDLGDSYCQATVNSTGSAAAIQATGSASVAANDLFLSASPVPDQPGIFFYGPDKLQIPFGDGFRCVGGIVGRLPITNGSGNALTYAFDNTLPPNPDTQITVGSTWHFQAWFRDPGAGASGFNLSDGLTITFAP